MSELEGLISKRRQLSVLRSQKTRSLNIFRYDYEFYICCWAWACLGFSVCDLFFLLPRLGQKQAEKKRGEQKGMASRSEVVLFGDSLTQGSFRDGRWGAALSHHLSRSANVLPRGYSGYNTRQALMVIHKAMEGVGSPAAFTVFFGANDAALPDRSAASVHVPLFEYTINLRAICAFIKAKWPSALVILITPPPIDEEGRLRFPYGNRSGLPERTNAAAGTYAKACISVAEQFGLPVIDIWTKMQQFSNWEKTFLWDGLHFTALGNHLLFQEVVKALRDHGVVDY